MCDLRLAVQKHYNTVHLDTFKYMAPVYVIIALIVLEKLLQWYVNYNNFKFMIGIH
jgi:hypothetical protein